MGLFRKKQKTQLGIDFGAGGIKLVELRGEGKKGRLFTYGFLERAPDEIGTAYLENSQLAAGILKSICEKARVVSKTAVAALPIPSVFSSVISIAAVPRKELAEAVKWEAKKLIPLPLEEVALDFKELKSIDAPAVKINKEDQASRVKSEDGGNKTIEILLTAAPKSIIENYVEIAKGAGLALSSLETEAFALIRALLGDDSTPTVIIDIGALRSNILMVDHGIPMLTRSVQVGGKNCTEALAKQVGIDINKAELMKRDLISEVAGGQGGALPPVLEQVLQPLLNELQYSFNVYRTRNIIARPPERILLTGGGAQVPGIVEFLQNQFNLRTFLGNPWERVDCHPDLVSLLQTLGTRFAVAIGLALRNI